ncbi:hypothetical protein ACPC54_36285 [Kitasatospora sp. NPDC094028]
MPATATTHRQPVSHTPLFQHLRRAAGRDRNPVCRPVDRAYSRLVVGQSLVVLAVFAVAAVAALLVYRAQAQAVARQARHRHTVTAVTTGPALPADPWAGDVLAGAGRALAPARWTFPSGPGAGNVAVPDGTPAGTALPVALDDAGHPLGAAKGGEEIVSDAVVTGLGTVFVLGLAAEAGYALRRRALERRAEQGWEAAWEQVEPRWSGRR